MMKSRDGLPSSTAYSHRFVTSRHTRVLMKFHHANRDGVRRLCHGPANGALNAVHNGCGRDIIGVMLDRFETGYRGKLCLRHAAMEPQSDDDWTAVGETLIQRLQRGNKVETSGSVRDADGGAVERGPGAQGPGRVLCCTNSHVRATQKGSVEISGGHQGSSQVLVLGS